MEETPARPCRWPRPPWTRTAKRLVPTTWLAVLFFVLLIAPGLLYDLLSEQRRLRAGESGFREASRTVLASLIISSLSVGILVAIRLVQPRWMPDPNSLFSGAGDYVTNHYRLILRTLFLEGIFALSIAAGFHWILTRRVRARLRTVSTWTRVFREDCPEGFLPHAQIRLSNGMTYIGQVGHFTADLETADREIVLVPPLYVKKPDGQFKDMPSEWQRVVLSGASIDSLTVQYRPKHQSHASGNATRFFRLPWVKRNTGNANGSIPIATAEQMMSDAIPSANGATHSKETATVEALMPLPPSDG
jgi:hypothetical protein